jgi:hypothetical protein
MSGTRTPAHKRKGPGRKTQHRFPCSHDDAQGSATGDLELKKRHAGSCCPSILSGYATVQSGVPVPRACTRLFEDTRLPNPSTYCSLLGADQSAITRHSAVSVQPGLDQRPNPKLEELCTCWYLQKGSDPKRAFAAVTCPSDRQASS